jgi:hypothetical protein
MFCYPAPATASDHSRLRFFGRQSDPLDDRQSHTGSLELSIAVQPLKNAEDLFGILDVEPDSVVALRPAIRPLWAMVSAPLIEDTFSEDTFSVFRALG